MVYVDLNPIRAKMADTPETSDHTSIKLRIQSTLKTDQPDYKVQPKCLFPFVGNPRDDMPEGLPFELADYIELIEITCMDALISRLQDAKERGQVDRSVMASAEK